MEEGLFKTIQKQAETGASTPFSPASHQFSNISFSPQVAPAAGTKISPRMRDIFATTGLIFGGVAVISWFVIVIGILATLVGASLSFLGRTSTSKARWAKTGLILSIVGGLFTLLYMAAIYAGLINYNYFTNELWGIPAGGVQVLE